MSHQLYWLTNRMHVNKQKSATHRLVQGHHDTIHFIFYKGKINNSRPLQILADISLTSPL